MQTIDFIHPEDAAALEALKKIPVLPAVIKSFMDLGVEQLQTGLNMASKVKLSPTQLPELYHILPSICELLDIKEPDFYLEMNPIPNAYAFGDTQTAITITSALVEMMSEFYKNLTAGKSKQESLQKAQNYVKNYMVNGEKKYQAPSYWAAFVILDAIN